MMNFFWILSIFLINIINAIPIDDSYTAQQITQLHLNTSNYLFQSSKSPNYLKINANIGDKIDLLCPKITSTSNDNQYLILYKVDSKYEFDNCFINKANENTVLVFKCDKPTKQLKYTMHFIKFSPVPNAIEFEQNKEYFFLTTSTGTHNGIYTQQGGLCSKYNLKFSIQIQPDLYDDAPHQPQDADYNSFIESQKLEQEALEERAQLDNNNFLSFLFTGVAKPLVNNATATTTESSYVHPSNMKFMSEHGLMTIKSHVSSSSNTTKTPISIIIGILILLRYV